MKLFNNKYTYQYIILQDLQRNKDMLHIVLNNNTSSTYVYTSFNEMLRINCKNIFLTLTLPYCP